jgi:hypothetical protein
LPNGRPVIQRVEAAKPNAHFLDFLEDARQSIYGGV